MARAFYTLTNDPSGERRYPSWRDAYGVVHMVGLHTANSIRTECNIIIARGSGIAEQMDAYEEAWADPNCLFCVAEWQPF